MFTRTDTLVSGQTQSDDDRPHDSGLAERRYVNLITITPAVPPNSGTELPEAQPSLQVWDAASQRNNNEADHGHTMKGNNTYENRTS